MNFGFVILESAATFIRICAVRGPNGRSFSTIAVNAPCGNAALAVLISRPVSMTASELCRQQAAIRLAQSVTVLPCCKSVVVDFASPLLGVERPLRGIHEIILEP